MPKVVHGPYYCGTKPILKNDYLDPLGCVQLHVVPHARHRLSTYPLEKRSEFEKDENHELYIEPWNLAQAGFYYADNDSISCCECAISIHLTNFLSEIKQKLGPHKTTPWEIHLWHRSIAPYCKFALDNTIGFFNLSAREDFRLASLLEAKWRNPALWQNMKSNVLEMARSGFYLDNQGKNASEDQVKCFSCDTVVHSWQDDDTPDEEHKKFFPKCPYLNAKSETKFDVAGNIPIGTEDLTASYDAAIRPSNESDSVENDSCRYPVCRDINFREHSFPATWPHSSYLSPAVMAAAGFFYVNNLKDDGDRVACYNCGVAAESWIEGDDPAEFHTQSSPSCNLAV